MQDRIDGSHRSNCKQDHPTTANPFHPNRHLILRFAKSVPSRWFRSVPSLFSAVAHTALHTLYVSHTRTMRPLIGRQAHADICPIHEYIHINSLSNTPDPTQSNPIPSAHHISRPHRKAAPLRRAPLPRRLAEPEAAPAAERRGLVPDLRALGNVPLGGRGGEFPAAGGAGDEGLGGHGGGVGG